MVVPPSIVVQADYPKEGEKDGKKFKFRVFFDGQYEILVGVPIIPHIFIDDGKFSCADLDIRGTWTAIPCKKSKNKKPDGTGLQWTPTADVIGKTLIFHLHTRYLPHNATATFTLKKVMDRSQLMISPPLRPRKMVKIDEGEPNVRVMSFNILMHESLEKMQIDTDRIWACGWNYRHQMILEEIKMLKPTIICFQEVENDYFPRLLEKELQNTKYKLNIFYKKDPNCSYSCVDGCCLAYMDEEYECNKADDYSMDFRKEAREDFLHKGKKEEYELCNNFNVVQAVHLRSKKGKKDIFMVNLHLTAFNKLTARTYQILKLMKLVKDKATGCPLIICGDFNSRPESEIYQFMQTGEASFPSGVEWSHFENIAPERKMSHQLSGLMSAYSLVGSSKEVEANELFQLMNQATREPELTFGKKDEMCTLDYIFFSSEEINCTEVLGLWSKMEMVEAGGLPHPDRPSDHVSIMANFN